MKYYYISQGILYFPLVYDKKVIADLDEDDPDTVIYQNGLRFVKGIDLQDKIQTSPDFEERVENMLNFITGDQYFKNVPRDLKTLMLVLFRVFPAFSSLREKVLLDQLLATEYIKRAQAAIGNYHRVFDQKELDIDFNWSRVVNEQEYHALIEDLKDKLIYKKAIRVVKKKSDQFKEFEKHHARIEKRLAIVLRVLENINHESLEFENVGISKIDGNIYCYLKIDSYRLMDTDKAVYQFPGCRVGIDLNNLLRIIVLDHYEHPFLNDSGSMQDICFGSAPKRGILKSHSIIANLNNGIQILQMGWPAENPYHDIKSFSHLRIGYFHDLQEKDRLSITNLNRFPDLELC